MRILSSDSPCTQKQPKKSCRVLVKMQHPCALAQVIFISVVMLTLATRAKIQGSRVLFRTNHDVGGRVGRRTRTDCAADRIGERTMHGAHTSCVGWTFKCGGVTQSFKCGGVTQPSVQIFKIISRRFFIFQNLIIRTRSCGTGFITKYSFEVLFFHFELTTLVILEFWNDENLRSSVPPTIVRSELGGSWGRLSEKQNISCKLRFVKSESQSTFQLFVLSLFSVLRVKNWSWNWNNQKKSPSKKNWSTWKNLENTYRKNSINM